MAQGAVMSLNIAHKACNKTLPLFILSSYFQWFSETRNQEMGHKKSRNGPLTRAHGQTKANRVVPTHLGLSPQSVKTKINPNISVQKLYPPFLIHRVDRIMRGCEICLCCNCTGQEFLAGNGRWSNWQEYAENRREKRDLTEIWFVWFSLQPYIPMTMTSGLVVCGGGGDPFFWLWERFCTHARDQTCKMV